MNVKNSANITNKQLHFTEISATTDTNLKWVDTVGMTR